MKASEAAWERRIYLPLHHEDEDAWNALHLMTTNDVSERDRLALILAKAAIDALDVRLLRELARRSDGASLDVLEQLVSDWGADPRESVAPLRLLQALRSSGSAHVKGTNYERVLERSGLSELAPAQQFEHLVRTTGAALASLAESISGVARSTEGGG